MTDTAVQHRPTEDLVVSTHREGATAVVVVRGDVGIATVPLLRAVLDGVCATGPARIEVDLSAAASFDSHALTVLVAARRRMAGQRAVLAIREPSPLVRRVLARSGLERAFEYARPAEPPGPPEPTLAGRPGPG